MTKATTGESGGGPPAAPLVVRNLKKQYRSRQGSSTRPSAPAVDGISFDVHAGECFGLLGPNGAGKSTTIQCLIGFYPPTEGSVSLMGHDVHRAPKAARQFLGVCPQDDTLDSDFSVLDQMLRHASFFRIAVKESRARSQKLLEDFGLWDRRDDMVESLSGGMRRRLQVARALVSDPKVLVLDEPTTGLDPEARRALWDVLVRARETGLAVLLSTHYMDEAERLCDRIAILHQGKILDVAPPGDLVLRHVGEAEMEEEIRPGVKWKRAPNLEDVFLKLTGRALQTGGAT